MNIICFSTTDWDEIWGSRQQIMLRLAQAGHRVLFIERQVSIEHLLRDPVLLRRKLKSWKDPVLREGMSNLWLWCPPMNLPGRYYSMRLNQLGQYLLASKVQPILQSLEFTHPILWLYPPHSAPLLGKFSESCSIYHCIDRFSGNQNRLKRSIMEKQEKLLLQNTDLVFTHADGLRRKYANLTHRPITLIPSAADVTYFQTRTEIHPEIAILPHPRIGIMGTFDGRLDVELLHELINSHPHWHFLFVGQIRPGRTKVRSLFSFPNVNYLGASTFHDLPMVLNGMDVFLIAYKQNELTKYINPLKLYEYLAIGKPIVSVPLPEVLPLSTHVYLANPSEFSDQIKRALEIDTPAQQQARREIAKQHTWDIRVQKILETIYHFLDEE